MGDANAPHCRTRSLGAPRASLHSPPPAPGRAGSGERAWTAHFAESRGAFQASVQLNANRLLKRLQRLVRAAKEHPHGALSKTEEALIVPWTSAENPICNSCYRDKTGLNGWFGHHCRLCGREVCRLDQCSRLVSLAGAADMLAEKGFSAAGGVDCTDDEPARGPSGSGMLETLSAALSGVQIAGRRPYSVRICSKCSLFVEFKLRSKRPFINFDQFAELYAQSAALRAKIEAHFSGFDSQIALLDGAGPVAFVAVTMQHRENIATNFESLQAKIKEIVQYPACLSDQADLQRAIGRALLAFVQEKMVQLKKRKHAPPQRAPKSDVIAAVETGPSQGIPNSSLIGSVNVLTDKILSLGPLPRRLHSLLPIGAKPVPTETASSQDLYEKLDVMGEQQAILQSLIDQARSNGSVDDVPVLERSLREIKNEIVNLKMRISVLRNE